MNDSLRFIVICVLFTVMGLIGGFMAANQTASTHKSHVNEDHPHSAHEEKMNISPEAAKNLGIEVADVELASFSSYRSIPAMIEETPLTVQPLFAPIEAVVKDVKVKHGSVVEGDEVVVTLLRDAVTRPRLNVTAELLDPERRLKGLTAGEISSIENNTPVERQLILWKLALKRNGYWPILAENIYKTLPKKTQDLPFSVAVLGELSANALLTQELLQYFESDKAIGPYFFEIASLLLQGKGFSYVKNLCDLGALDTTIEIKAPIRVKDWDVHGVFVTVGEHVKKGEELISLHNPRELHMVVHAKGSEIAVLIAALEKKKSLKAVPLTKGAATELRDLTIRNVEEALNGQGGAVVHLEVVNNPLIINTDNSGTRYRSWKVRVGSKYILRVPQKIFDEVYVLPNEAVVFDGPERIVYIKNGESYDATSVVVLYEDDEVAVLSRKDSNIFPDETVVVQGAFGLDIAMKAGKSGPVDPHAGHSH